MDGRPREAHGRGRDGQEGRDGGACVGTCQLVCVACRGLCREGGGGGGGLLRTLVAELAVFLHGAVCLLLLFHVFRGRKVGCVQ